jgi:hypothetical protein
MFKNNIKFSEIAAERKKLLPLSYQERGWHACSRLG